MELGALFKLLKAKKSEFKDVDFAYIAPTESLELVRFTNGSDATRFINSFPEEQSFIFLEPYEDGKCFHISTQDYEANIVDDGKSFYIADYTKGRPAAPAKEIDTKPIDPEELRKEFERLFKLAQEEGDLLHTFH